MWPKRLCVCVCVVVRPEETSISHPQRDGVGTDGLSSLPGLPRRFRWDTFSTSSLSPKSLGRRRCTYFASSLALLCGRFQEKRLHLLSTLDRCCGWFVLFLSVLCSPLSKRTGRSRRWATGGEILSPGFVRHAAHRWVIPTRGGEMRRSLVNPHLNEVRVLRERAEREEDEGYDEGYVRRSCRLGLQLTTNRIIVLFFV